VPRVYSHNIATLGPCQTSTAVRNLQQQQQDAVQTEGCQPAHQAKGSYVNDKTLDALGTAGLSNRNHTQGTIKPTSKLTPASKLNPAIGERYFFFGTAAQRGPGSLHS